MRNPYARPTSDILEAPKEVFQKREIPVVELYGFVTNVRTDGYDKEYYMVLTDEFIKVLEQHDNFDQEETIQEITKHLSAYIGHEVRAFDPKTEYVDRVPIYRLTFYVKELNGKEGTLDTAVRVFVTDVFEKLGQSCEDYYLNWTIEIELPQERVEAMLFAVGGAIEVVGEGDRSMISTFCRLYE